MDTVGTLRSPARPYALGLIALALVALVGLYHVKWGPYYHRVYVAAAQHSIGVSIISGRAAEAPPASWHAALDYAWAYGKAIWQAMILGLLLGSGVQALVPRDWLVRLFGRVSFKGVALAGVAGVPSMM